MSPAGVEKRAILHRHTYGIRRLDAQRPPDGHAQANDDQEDTRAAGSPQKQQCATSRQPPTRDTASEQSQDIRPCACFPPEFIRLRIRNFAEAKTVYEDPYSAECGTEVLKEIPQRLKGGGIKPVKDGSTAFECDRTLSSTEALKYGARICTDGIRRYQTTCIRQGQESAKCRIGFDSTPVDGKRRM